MFYANVSARGFFAGGSASAPSDAVPALGPDEYLDATPDVLADIVEGLTEIGQWSGELVAVNTAGRRMPVEVVVVANTSRRRRDRVLLRALARPDRAEARRSARSGAARRCCAPSCRRRRSRSSRSTAAARSTCGTAPPKSCSAGPRRKWSAASAPFATEENAAEIDDLIARVFRGRTVKGYLGRFADRDGGRVDVERVDRTAAQQRRRVVTAVAVMADVSEQTRATQALLEIRDLVPLARAALERHGARGERRGKRHLREPARGRLRRVATRRRFLQRPAGEFFTFADDDLGTMRDAFERLRADAAID